MKLNKPVFVINKRADRLTEALKKSPRVVTIWVRSGKFKNRYPLIRSAVVYEARSNIDARDYKKRFLEAYPIPKTHTKLSVLKGISRNQITELLSYTKKDRLIRTKTYDFNCFKSKRTFLSWKNRGKTIYTLSDRKGRLLGVIWYDKRQKGVRLLKPTIRIYPPAREKNISKKFLDIVRRNYQSKTKKSTIPKNR